MSLRNNLAGYADGREWEPVHIRDYPINIKDSYVLFMDLPTKEGFPEGTIVNNVEICWENGRKSGFNFTHAETGEEAHTMYGWILVENSEENLRVYKELQRHRKIVKLLERQEKLILERLKRMETVQWGEMPEVINDDFGKRDD